MAALYIDENVPRELADRLRQLGHDILTALEAGQANQKISDPDQLAYATQIGRAILTNNRWDFHRLHSSNPNHQGIVTFTDDADLDALASRIHRSISARSNLIGQLVKVTKSS
jgi:hypothetical protein